MVKSSSHKPNSDTIFSRSWSTTTNELAEPSDAIFFCPNHDPIAPEITIARNPTIPATTKVRVLLSVVSLPNLPLIFAVGILVGDGGGESGCTDRSLIVNATSQMDYISPERSLDGTCGDPGPLFGDQDGCLLEHMDYHGEGITQPESPPLNDGLLVDAADQISYLSADSVPYMNDQIMCNTMKSASTSPASPLKQDEEHHVHIESDMQNDAAERKVHHNDDCEVRTTSPGYDVHQNTEVVEGVLPPELHESSGNDISNFQQETTHFDAYLGDSMLADNSSRDYQFSNSGDDDDEIPNSSAPQMGNKDNRKLHETFHNEVNEADDDQMNGGNSNPHDEHDNENFNSATAPSYLDGMEQEDPGTENGISTPGNQWDSPPERVIIWLTLEAHQQDIGPDLLDLLKTMTPTVEELPHMSCLHMHGITLQKEKHNLGVEMGHRAEDLHPLEEEMGHRSEDQLPLKEETGHRDEDQLPLEEDMVHHAEDLHPLKEEMGHLAEDLHPPKEDTGHHDEDLHPLKGGMGHHGEDLHPLKGGMGHHGEDLHLLKEEPHPRGGVHQGGGIPQQGGIPLQEGETHQEREIPHQGGGIPQQGGIPLQEGETHQEREIPHQGGGIPQQGGIPLQEGETHQEREIPHQGGGIPQQGGIPLQEGETHQEREIPLQGGGNPQQERGTPQQGREIDQNQGHHQGKLIPLDIKGSMVDLDQGLHTLGITIEDLQGFSYATTERELEKKFAKFGRVTRVRVVRDKRTGDSRGFGFLSLEKDEDADAAIRACDETEWNGRIILVEKSKAPAWSWILLYVGYVPITFLLSFLSASTHESEIFYAKKNDILILHALARLSVANAYLW
ncbi:Putative RNA-binding protein rbpE [Triticum urartu]|uniref:Putative RNA-binding protein rbpE n=1 Tax=Triticum urartu TaxID=4572 RepID=M8AUF4_TRIUA|nr:Putative RNA-binding protein rbpE [Triticum urartu]